MKLPASLLSVAFIAVTAHAGFVTWDPATDIAGDSDVSTAGTLVNAVSLGSPFTNPTVNGVTFTSANGGSFTSGNFAFSGFLGGASTPLIGGLSASYGQLLSTYQNGGLLGLDITGLTLGATYQFQFWAGGLAPAKDTATSGNSVTLNTAPSPFGQYAIGTFTADAATQSIAFSAAPGTTVLNAAQLRQLSAPPVPEPGTVLFGLGILCTALLRRRR